MLLPLLIVAASIELDAPPASRAEIAADAALEEVWNARRRVFRALCGDDAHARRMRGTDADLETVRRAYRQRFGHEWDAPVDTSDRQWECSFPNGFEWTLASYRNAITVAQATLTSR